MTLEKEPRTVNVPAHDLRVGDVVRMWFGWVRITSFAPYRGPYSFILAIVHHSRVGLPFSLEDSATFDIIADGRPAAPSPPIAFPLR